MARSRRRKSHSSRALTSLLAAVLGVIFYLLAETRASKTPVQEEPSASPPSTQTSTKQSKPSEGVIFSPQHPKNFDEAKRILKGLFPQGKDFYCNCPYDLGARQVIDAAGCGFKSSSSRGRRIEWEHVVPASIFGRQVKAWSEGDPACLDHGQMKRGRNCAREVSEVFRQMEADLYNLLPAVGELNRARANFAFGEVADEPRSFGACDFEVKKEIVEPRPSIRGDIARIYFYMDSRYPNFGILPPAQLALFEAWNRDDPLEREELARIEAIEKVQGNSFFIGRIGSKRSEGRRPSQSL